VALAVVIEAGDSKPGAISTGLTSLGIEVVGKGIVMGENSAIDL
jgi:hypothetical protein